MKEPQKCWLAAALPAHRNHQSRPCKSQKPEARSQKPFRYRITAMVKRAPAKRRPRKAKAGTRGLEATECRLEASDAATSEVVELIEKAGGSVMAAYRDPLGGHPMLLSVLPIGAIEPTPFQRDLSDTHHKRLADVIDKTGRFLDPIIAVTAPEGGFWTPNGLHRLRAMRRLGAKAITALVVIDREIAWQILALNTEKAHNLKERSLEVIRIY